MIYDPDVNARISTMWRNQQAMGNAQSERLRMLSNVGLTNAYVPPEVLRLRRAQKIAAEVRARRPEMQIKRIKP